MADSAEVLRLKSTIEIDATLASVVVQSLDIKSAMKPVGILVSRLHLEWI